jgi:hypothetical protein
MNPTAKGSELLLGCIGEVLCAEAVAIADLRFFLFLSSRVTLKFLRAKKEAQEAFDDKIN